jgi:hypothetical protein
MTMAREIMDVVDLLTCCRRICQAHRRGDDRLGSPYVAMPAITRVILAGPVIVCPRGTSLPIGFLAPRLVSILVPDADLSRRRLG